MSTNLLVHHDTFTTHTDHSTTITLAGPTSTELSATAAAARHTSTTVHVITQLTYSTWWCVTQVKTVFIWLSRFVTMRKNTLQMQHSIRCKCYAADKLQIQRVSRDHLQYLSVVCFANDQRVIELSLWQTNGQKSTHAHTIWTPTVSNNNTPTAATACSDSTTTHHASTLASSAQRDYIKCTKWWLSMIRLD